MTDSLFEVVASATRELTKYGFSTQEFATLVQQHNMTDVEVLAVAKVFDYLLEKRERSPQGHMCCNHAKFAFPAGGVPYCQRTSSTSLSAPQPERLKGGFAIMKSALS